jgi:hypothetical protein
MTTTRNWLFSAPSRPAQSPGLTTFVRRTPEAFVPLRGGKNCVI